jgi:hypothetical protein
MTTRLIARRALVTCLAGAALVAPVPSASAQLAPRFGEDLREAAPVRALEGFLTRYQLDTERGNRLAVDGVGGRFLWTSSAALTDPASLAARTSVGVFGVFLPEQNRLGFSMLHGGAELNVRPLAAPILARIEPLLSFGVGALRTHVAELSQTRARDLALADRSNVALALSPGAGARIALVPGLDLRADARDVVTFRDGVRNHVAWNVGLGMTF